MAKDEERRSKIGQWLRDNAPDILQLTGGVLPFGDGLQALGRLIEGKPDIPDAQKQEFLRMLHEQEVAAQKEVTERWKADMQSDVKLAKHIRPYTLIFCLALYTIVMIWDSADSNFNVSPTYLSILELLLMTVFGAYFAGRTLEKGVKTWRAN
jgi:hypothetical protein